METFRIAKKQEEEEVESTVTFTDHTTAMVKKIPRGGDQFTLTFKPCCEDEHHVNGTYTFYVGTDNQHRRELRFHLTSDASQPVLIVDKERSSVFVENINPSWPVSGVPMTGAV